MLQPGRELDLAPEAFLIDTRRHLGRQHLDHHTPAEVHFLGEEDAAHAPPTQFPIYSVGVAHRPLKARLEFCHPQPLPTKTSKDE